MTLLAEARKKAARKKEGRAKPFNNGPTNDAHKEKTTKKSQAAQLVELAETVTCLHSPTEEPFARFPVGDHQEMYPLKSKSFRRWLTRQYYVNHEKPPSEQALQDALSVLEGKALFDGPEMPVFVRIGEHDGAIYLDLCNKAWQAVKITPAGWNIVNHSPVAFRRTKGLRPLPIPVKGGCITELRPFVNVADENNWRLLVAWLIAAFRPRGPYPLLGLHGEQGCAKSTTARTIRSLIDPSTAPLRSEPREPRDLMIAATNSWVVAFDNLSSVPVWLSDALCRLANPHQWRHAAACPTRQDDRH